MAHRMHYLLPTGDPKPPLRVAIKKARVIQSDSIEKETYPVQLSGADGNITRDLFFERIACSFKLGKVFQSSFKCNPQGNGNDG